MREIVVVNEVSYSCYCNVKVKMKDFDDDVVSLKRPNILEHQTGHFALTKIYKQRLNIRKEASEAASW